MSMIRKKTFGMKLEFTPLEFETLLGVLLVLFLIQLEFTPLEFETLFCDFCICHFFIRIYSVGV